MDGTLADAAGDPTVEGGRRVPFYSGDHQPAKAQLGGRLAQFPGGPLPSLNLVKFG